MLKPSEEAGVGIHSSWEDRTAIRQVMFVKILNKMLLHVMELIPPLMYFLTFFCLTDIEKLSLISIHSLANSNPIN